MNKFLGLIIGALVGFALFASEESSDPVPGVPLDPKPAPTTDPKSEAEKPPEEK